MRTTLDIDDHLLAAARERAAVEGRTLTSVVEDALAAALASPARMEPCFRLDLPTERGRYVGRVDIADRDALYDAMDDRL